MRLASNDAGGVDLIIERDEGNLVRILTGKPENSLKMWHDLQILCRKVIKVLNKAVIAEIELKRR